MRRAWKGAALLALIAALAGCGKGKGQPLDTDETIVRSVLDVLASDGKPVCVSRLTYGSPLDQFRVARRGRLERYYALQWYPPGPYRPPEMPTQAELRQAVVEGRDANIPEPPARTDELPRELRSELDGTAFDMGIPAVETHSAVITGAWAPPNVHPRWWFGDDAKLGCTANYVVSGIKRNDHVAFVAIRVDHWGTLYALVPEKGGWKVIAQWGNWLY